ncbi:MAG: 16S rRNA (guanine(527)-N(7))-methyltransferase RsmG [Zoogloeaceae bacterium]|jgi:16S rRNA (guanine527-N7)-methyltransferase|nr:16S rRNA (guanine(527)-N(7))-methyltransferase RsmG [Zoogloeaceae bacterium]
MNDNSNDKKTLERGLALLRLPLPELTLADLLRYRNLLLKWNRIHNLTAIDDPERMLVAHLLDSLAILPWVHSGKMLDVGSGGGLPGMALAIVRREQSFTLLDAAQKKCIFLRQAAIELHLPGVSVQHTRVEDATGAYDQILSRGFASLDKFTALTAHLLAPGGTWLAMKGIRPDAEIAALPPEIEVRDLIRLEVPGLDAERHLVILGKASTI